MNGCGGLWGIWGSWAFIGWKKGPSDGVDVTFFSRNPLENLLRLCMRSNIWRRWLRQHLQVQLNMEAGGEGGLSDGLCDFQLSNWNGAGVVVGLINSLWGLKCLMTFKKKCPIAWSTALCSVHRVFSAPPAIMTPFYRWETEVHRGEIACSMSISEPCDSKPRDSKWVPVTFSQIQDKGSQGPLLVTQATYISCVDLPPPRSGNWTKQTLNRSSHSVNVQSNMGA